MLCARAYKRGRGHAPRVHDMARQNSNQQAGYAKFRLRALRTLSNVTVPYQFYHTRLMRCVYGAHAGGMATTIYSSVFEFCRVRAVHALFSVYKPLISLIYVCSYVFANISKTKVKFWPIKFSNLKIRRVLM